MNKRIYLTLRIDTTAAWTQVDLVDKWVKLIHVSADPILSEPEVRVSYPSPFAQYRPSPSLPTSSGSLFTPADLTQAVATIAHLDNPTGAPVSAQLHMALEFPEDLGEDPAYSVQTIRFGVAKSDQGYTNVTFGLDEYPTLQNGWAGAHVEPRGWPHLMCDVPVVALLEKAVVEQDAAQPIVEGIAPILQKSADVFARSRQKTTDKADKVLSDDVFRRPPV